MLLQKTHKFFSFSKLFKLVLGMAFVLQLIVITYNHFSGYHELKDFNEFLLRVIRGIIYSMVAGFAIAYPDLLVIQFLNKHFQWDRSVIKRAVLQFFLMLVIALVVSSLLTLFANWVSPYRQGLRNVLFNNMLIYSVVNAFFMSILEAWTYLEESVSEKRKAEKLQEDLIEEAANKAIYKAQILVEEEKNRSAQMLIEQEKQLNESLALEIKKREQISIQLKESREQLQSILSNLPGAAYRCFLDQSYSMKYISEKIFDISGYHASDLIGDDNHCFDSIIHPEDMDFYRNNIHKAASLKNHYEFEYRIIHKDGNIVWVSENGKWIYSKEDKTECLDGIIIDITRRKEAEILAAESELNYKEMMEFLPQPIFELDINGNILFMNKSGYDYFGISKPDDSQTKLSALDLMVEEDVPKVVSVIKNSNQPVNTNPNEYTVKRPGGKRSPVLIYGTPKIRHKKVVGRRGIIVDISERKKYELNLLKAKEELEHINNTLEQSIAKRTKELTEANTQLLKAQKENLQSQFEVLKQQVNPHFLFNSLNVLTSLIKIDPDLAESFTERLSKVYRYVLENKEKDLVSLITELEFLNSYLFLLEIRFMNKIIVKTNIDKSFYDYLILPIAIQLIIENAIKHNAFSKNQPLVIEIFVDKELRLNIVNNLNVRETKTGSTGVGLENITRRYALVSDQKPEFTKTNKQFIAKIPLLKVDYEQKENS
ncbi:MAG: PAS domain S-box protein [Bacteroidales bacterium]|nr:PAS domain S-box protein [Bacteroidales bacterium]MCF8392139.1 PAS domain S-box protein [Bacteroidales bacterium]